MSKDFFFFFFWWRWFGLVKHFLQIPEMTSACIGWTVHRCALRLVKFLSSPGNHSLTRTDIYRITHVWQCGTYTVLVFHRSCSLSTFSDSSRLQHPSPAIPRILLSEEWSERNYCFRLASPPPSSLSHTHTYAPCTQTRAHHVHTHIHTHHVYKPSAGIPSQSCPTEG